CISIAGSLRPSSARRALTRPSAASAAKRSPAVPAPANKASILRSLSRNWDSGDIANLANGFEHVQPEHPIIARSIVQIAMSTSIARLRHARESQNRDRLATLTFDRMLRDSVAWKTLLA